MIVNSLDVFKKICEIEGIKISALEDKIGASKGVLSRAINKRTDIQSKWLMKLIQSYPEYNLEWLFTGRGKMKKQFGDLLGEETVIDNKELFVSDKERMEKVLHYLKKSKNALGISIGDVNGMRITHVINGRNKISKKLAKDISSVYKEFSYDWLITGNGSMLLNDSNMIVNKKSSWQSIRKTNFLNNKINFNPDESFNEEGIKEFIKGYLDIFIRKDVYNGLKEMRFIKKMLKELKAMKKKSDRIYSSISDIEEFIAKTY